MAGPADDLHEEVGQRDLGRSLEPVHPPLRLPQPGQRCRRGAGELEVDERELVAELRGERGGHVAQVDGDHRDEVDRLGPGLLLVGAQGRRHRAEQHVVEGGAGQPADRLGRLQGDGVGPGDPLRRARVPGDRVRRVVAEDEVGEHLGRRHREPGGGEQALRRAQPQRLADGRAGEGDAEGHQPGARVVGPRLVNGRGDPVPDRRRRRRGSAGQLVGQRHEHAAQRQPVGEGMVDPGDDRGPGSMALDEVRLPERVGRVEGDVQTRLHPSLERGVVTGAGEPLAVQVPPDVEVLVVDPVRSPGEAPGRLAALAEDRVPVEDAVLEEVRHLVPVRRPGEEHHGDDDHEVLRPVHRQPDRVHRGDGPAVRHGHSFVGSCPPA